MEIPGQISAEIDSIEERAFSVTEAQAANEVFITSASNFVLPVVKVDGSMIANGKPGLITGRLRQLYINFASSTAKENEMLD
jgi:D-alanine transaminase